MNKLQSNIFISQSQERAKEMGEFLVDWLQNVMGSSARPWIASNPKDLKQGSYDHLRIVEAARAAEICLLILTPENHLRPWILFEPGMFYGQGKDVLYLLCGNMKHGALKEFGYPVEGYGTYPNKESMWGLIIRINDIIKEEERPLRARFEKFYQDFDEKYKAIFNAKSDSLISEEEDLMKAIASLEDADAV